MTLTEARVRKAFKDQARWCQALGSPFTSLLCDVVGTELDRSSEIGRQILDYSGPPDALGDAIPLRLAGGLHALARRGCVTGLQELYPPNPMPDREDLWRAVRHAMTVEEEFLISWLAHPPQTNEVARSAILMAGLLIVADETGLPIELYEPGASAGLNLMLDRYGYCFGTARRGDQSSRLMLAPEWSGGAPPEAEVRIVSRRGVDLHPLDVTQPAHRERLIAYLWPDQPERLGRVEAAMAIAAQAPPAIDRADAADWLERMIALPAKSGSARVVMHSIAHQYFPDEVKRRIAKYLETVAADATRDAPLSWLRFEVDPAFDNLPTLRLSVWPGGEERVLAKANAHCQWIEWLV